MFTTANITGERRTPIGLSSRSVMLCLLMLGGALIAFISARFGFVAGVLLSLAPIAAFLLFGFVAKPYWGLIGVFTVNYFIIGIQRYVTQIPVGVIIDVLVGLTLLGVLVQGCYKKIEWGRANNGLTVVSAVWMLYCFLELFNLEGPSPVAWMTTVRGVGGYFFLLSLLTPVLFGSYRDLRRIIVLWSAFTVVAVIKAWGQKTFGFDSYELYWLYTRGEATHLIQSGLRFFSIFSDAANFGAGMGFSMVAFSIVALTSRNVWMKIYMLAVAALAGYAMMISGTRSAIAVPFAGYALYIVLSRNWKVAALFTVMIAGAFWFLNETMYLHGNAYVRRMRSAFDTNDPSMLVRLDNQDKIREYLRSRPFGGGIGMGGVKAQRYAPDKFLSSTPTDSWFVMIWAETGYVGIIIYMAILVYLLIKCSWIVMFRIKDRELRGVLGGALAGIFGIMMASAGNEILGQFPTGFIVYMMLAFIFMGPRLDSQILAEKQALPPPDEK